MQPTPKMLTDGEKIDNLTIAFNNVMKAVLMQQGIHGALEGALISLIATHPNPVLATADLMGRIEQGRMELKGRLANQLVLDGYEGAARNLISASRLAIEDPPAKDSMGLPH